jgi:hypothetical protein
LATARDDSINAETRGGWWSSPLLIRLAEGKAESLALLLVIVILHVTVGERLWSPLRNLVFDAYQHSMPRQVESSGSDYRYRRAQPGSLRPLAVAALAPGAARGGRAPARCASR